jgi:hypothetical protein
LAIGAFADDSPRRNDLGPHALRRAKEQHAVDFSPADTFIIGDVKDSDAGRYQVRVSNVVGEVASSEVVLAVHLSLQQQIMLFSTKQALTLLA